MRLSFGTTDVGRIVELRSFRWSLTRTAAVQPTALHMSGSSPVIRVICWGGHEICTSCKASITTNHPTRKPSERTCLVFYNILMLLKEILRTVHPVRN